MFMKLLRAGLSASFLLICNFSFSQNVGIGTNVPKARLHVVDSSVLFSAGVNVLNNAGDPPISGGGCRTMWYADKAAFRTGYVYSNGWDKTNVGNYSFAGGQNNTAKGENSMAMGVGCVALGASAMALGVNSEANSYCSFSYGNYAVANRSFAIAMGTGSHAEGFASLSIGEEPVSLGAWSMAFGSRTRAVGDYATTMGVQNVARSNYSLVIGQYNDSTGTNRLFEIGNGAGNTVRKNAMTVLTNGNTGLGTANPVNRLDIVSNNNWDLSNTEGDFRLGNATYRLKMGIALDGGGAGAATIRSAGGIERLSLGTGNQNLITMNGNNGNGFVGIGTDFPTQKLQVNGNIYSTGTITPSDSRFKTDIKLISDPLEKISQLNGMTYFYNAAKFPDHGFSDKEQVGVLAQDVEKVLPQIVFTDDKGYKAVDYTKLVPLLIESIKAQQTQITRQQVQINDLKATLSHLIKK